MAVATQAQLMWRRFRKHRLAMLGAVAVILFYLVVLLADFLAYADPEASDAQRGLIAPQQVQLFLDGQFRPHVYAMVGERDPATFKRVYTEDPTQIIPLTFFSPGFDYKLFGFIPTNRHLIGVEGANPEETLFLLGTDLEGRDMWSRLMYATRTSLTIGLVAVVVSLVLGVILGGISGFYGGMADTVIQRIIEILRSIPTIPLWMGLAAAMPKTWTITQVYFTITIIISLIGWTELARVVRGRFLSLREEDFVTAADLVGREPVADHLRPHGAALPQPHHRRDDAGAAGDGHQRDGVELPGSGLAAAGHQLGGAPAAGPERADGGALTLAAPAGRTGDPGHPGLQLPRRRSARRRRSVFVRVMGDGVMGG